MREFTASSVHVSSFSFLLHFSAFLFIVPRGANRMNACEWMRNNKQDCLRKQRQLNANVRQRDEWGRPGSKRNDKQWENGHLFCDSVISTQLQILTLPLVAADLNRKQKICECHFTFAILSALSKYNKWFLSSSVACSWWCFSVALLVRLLLSSNLVTFSYRIWMKLIYDGSGATMTFNFWLRFLGTEQAAIKNKLSIDRIVNFGTRKSMQERASRLIW